VEILYDVRARRRVVTRLLRAAPLLATLACAGGARDTATADTAVLQDTSADSLRYAGNGNMARTDSATVNASSDSSAELLSAFVVLAADSAAGDSLYRGKGRCLTCHGADLRGLSNLGPNLVDAEWLHSDGSLAGIRGTIAAGVARPKQAQIRMPAFATQLSSAELDRLAAYLYTISHRQATVVDSLRARADTLGATMPDST
jgi:mono/diheme cytochrome c family protein